MHDKLSKNARKRAKDPAQERLRQHKDEWNDVASLLIAKLIAFKRGINGAGDPRAQIPESKITEPLPKELETYLRSIIQDSQSLSEGAQSIMREQKDYAMSKSASVHPQLSAEASSAMSRAWARISLIGHPERGQRINILNQVSSMIADLYDLENELTSSKDPSRIARAILKYTSLLTNIGGGLGFLIYPMSSEQEMEDLAGEELAEEYEDEKPSSKKEDSEPKKKTKKKVVTEYEEEAPQAEVVISPLQKLDFVRNQLADLENYARFVTMTYPGDAPNLEPDVSRISKQESLIRNMIASDPEGLAFNNQKAIDELFAEHRRISEVLKQYPLDQPPPQIELENMKESLEERAALEKLAHNAITRWLNRKKLEILPGNFGTLVLRAVNSVVELRKGLNRLMDLAEDRKSSNKEIVSEYKKLFSPAEGAADSLGKLGRIYIANTKLNPEKSQSLNKSDLSNLNKALLSLKFQK